MSGQPITTARRVSSPKSERATVYDEVTQRIIGELEAGRRPWAQPWNDTACVAAALPRNALTARTYSGINILILWSAAVAQGFSAPGWLTFRQAQAAGGRIRKGARGTGIVFADRFVPRGGTEGRSDARERVPEDDDTARRGACGRDCGIPFLKRFTVFNVAQCDGLRADVAAAPVPFAPGEAMAAADVLIAASGADMHYGGVRAFYAPLLDYVQLPPKHAFLEDIDFYRVALHELTHWTGHSTRLARDVSGSFGSDGYAREELAAEMGAAFLCATLGIAPTVRHADYIGHWLDILRADNRAIFRAASAASRAADYLLAFRAARDGVTS